jgi:hypothetical protein
MEFRNKGTSIGKNRWQNHNLMEPSSWFRYIKHKIKDNININKEYFSLIAEHEDSIYSYCGTPEKFEIREYTNLETIIIFTKK